jgi:lipopolysaccharide export system ATP-binding protein
MARWHLVHRLMAQFDRWFGGGEKYPPEPATVYGDWLIDEVEASESPYPERPVPEEGRVREANEPTRDVRSPLGAAAASNALGEMTHVPSSRFRGAEPGSLVVRQLRKAYKARRVVEDVSLSVGRGEAVGLLGPNGAGKTTVFYMITGLVRPDAGTIEIDGYNVTNLPMYRRARLGIGYLPQEPSIFRGLSVEDNIMAVLEITQPDKRARAAELEALLDEFDIKRLRKSAAIALSGGERRRCEIARALAGRPSFMLLDEPFAGIDPIAVGDIQQLVRHLKQRGIGVLITDHAVRETLGLIDRAYIIHSGHVLTEGTPDRIVANPDVRRLYLGEDFRM